MDKRKIEQAIAAFAYVGEPTSYELHGLGHINDTYAVTCGQGFASRRYILQRINKDVFAEPVKLVRNIKLVSEYVRESVRSVGGDPDRESLTLIPTHDGLDYYLDSDGDYWRSYIFIEDAICYQTAHDPEIFYNSARGFGRFQLLLDGFDAGLLHETIPGFHDTRRRYEQLRQAIANDKHMRASHIKQEIDFALDRASSAAVLMDELEKGTLPLRVTHNDTKLNNVMMDHISKEAVCVIDLDTVMPGTSLFDYGDAIRFGASTAEEDEQDLSLVSVDLKLAEAYTRGFLETAGSIMIAREIELMTWGAKLMTLECGIRFLADYLNGDIYFKIHRPDQNLDRCRTQFKLVEDLENKWQTYQQMVTDNYSRIVREAHA
ncbi:MAG: hypothetical protein PWP10_4161 [Clostridiales bacterium]|jgi:hypothetical protein|nr:hypothetical protein [Clostridiales bacterium]